MLVIQFMYEDIADQHSTIATFTGATLPTLQAPSLSNINGTYCKPRVRITNNNNTAVTVFAGPGPNPTTSYGTLAANSFGTFSIDLGMSSGGMTFFNVRFYNASQGYSTSTSSTVNISTPCVGDN